MILCARGPHLVHLISSSVPPSALTPQRHAPREMPSYLSRLAASAPSCALLHYWLSHTDDSGPCAAPGRLVGVERVALSALPGALARPGRPSEGTSARSKRSNHPTPRAFRPKFGYLQQYPSLLCVEGPASPQPPEKAWSLSTRPA